MGRPTSLCCVCVSDLGLSLQTQAWLHSYVREQGRMRHCERDGEMERKRERQAHGPLHIITHHIAGTELILCKERGVSNPRPGPCTVQL